MLDHPSCRWPYLTQSRFLTICSCFWFRPFIPPLRHCSVYIQDHSLARRISFPSSISLQYHLHLRLLSQLWWQSTPSASMQYSHGSQPVSHSRWHHHRLFLTGQKPGWNLGDHWVARSDVDFENWVFCICIFAELKKKTVKVSVNMFKTETQIQ